MSVIGPKSGSLQQFFRSVPLPCPYIEGQVERKLFTRLGGPNMVDVNTRLSQAGFRRSHDIVYRPVCPACNACVPVRIPVAAYAPSRSARRILNVNADLTRAEHEPLPSREQYLLFTRYQSSRHGDSDMARMNEGDFAAMVEEGANGSAMIEYRDPSGALVATILVDRLHTGYSAVYSFFDPDASRRSLGTFMVLDLVRIARDRGLDHIYLGYWIAESRKMAYKARFRPLEALVDGTWRPIDP